ncbi:MAG: TrkA C-terminal domain-containing protein [Treponema sp.]|jgi:hypothetical protein|nr:TrkA C-terminal domain-containing protein [Treponema sp.]
MGGGKSGDNRGGRRRFSRRRGRESAQGARQENPREGKNAVEFAGANEVKPEKKRSGLYERPRWIPPVVPSKPMPVPDCPWCGKPIRDLSTAVADKVSGEPVHFDCVIARIREGETLEPGDVISYIGGGRFGIIHYNNSLDARDFAITKIFEWENKDSRSEWRRSVSDYFSVT